MRRGSPRWPMRISVWTEPGRWTTRTIRPADEARVVDRARRRGGARRPAVAEQARRDGRDVETGQVAADDERGASRVEAARPGRAEDLRREPLDGLLRAARRPVVRRARRVDRVDERLLGAAARVGLRLEDVVQPLVAHARDLVGGERRPEQDLGQQVERLRQPVRGDVQARREGVPARVGVDRRPEPLGRLDQADRVVALGALGEGAGREDRGPGLGRRLVHGAVAQHEGRGHEGPAGQVRDQHPQAVVEVMLGHGRELVRARGPGAGPVGDHRAVAADLGGAHAAASSDSSSDSASSSAAGPSGR